MEDELNFYIEQSVYNDVHEKAEKALYSMWVDHGEDFTPAVNLRTTEKLPSGVYKIAYENNDFVIKTVKLNNDELYSFSGSFTSQILAELNDFWSKENLYKENHLIHKRGLLLEGPAGSGKTSIVTLLINDIVSKDGIVFLVSNYKEFTLLYDALSPVVRKIEPTRRITTVIEDVDKLITENNGNDSEILDFLDGKGTIDDHAIIMTSNDTSDLSEAFLRPSRVDMRFIIPQPDKDIRREYFSKKGLDEKELNTIVKATDGLSFAGLKEVFIGTKVLGKSLDNVLHQLKNPIESKDYLNTTSKIGF